MFRGYNMNKKCVGCGKIVETNMFGKVKGGQEILYRDVICDECCKVVDIPLGVKGAFIASTYTKERFLKKYVKVKPEAMPLLEKYQQEKHIHKEEQQREKERQNKRKNCKEKSEEKYTCTVCGETWYNTEIDVLKNIFDITTSPLTLSNAKDLTKCPKCGSGANTHKTIKYWVDKKGNCVDREE